MEAYTARMATQYRQWHEANDGSTDPLEARDATYECKHGRLPGDRAVTCECWARK